MTKAAVIISAVLLLAGVATASTFTGLGGSSDRPSLSVPDSVRTDTEPGEDISGPCDEAEHANDPRCTGVQVPAERRQAGEDISGPCDEAEHANDTRCTGAAPDADDDDRRGRGRDDDDREDRSGPSENSGPGSVNSGHGDDDDRGGDDDDHRGGGNSGPGGGGDD